MSPYPGRRFRWGAARVVVLRTLPRWLSRRLVAPLATCSRVLRLRESNDPLCPSCTERRDMWFETIVREETGCAAYMIGCQRTNECAVFDPLWDIQPYLAMAKKQGSTIRYVIDSHSHADHISGARPLAASPNRRIFQASSCSSPATRAATSPARRSMSTAGA